MENPWKKLTSKKIYKNPWIEVREDQVITPGGSEGIYGVVSFKNYALGIIPISKDNMTFLVGQYRYPLDEYSWEIPMGGGDLNIDPIESAKRELQEETGLTANSWEHFMKIHTSNSVTDEVGHVYIAKELREGPTAFDETEDLKIKKIHINEACEMALKGEITDSVSLAALLKYYSIHIKK